jgi:CHAT domain-containing protein
VVTIPDGALSNLPWQALLVDGDRLSDRHHFVLAPSLRHYLRASDVKSDSDEIDIFVAQSGDLPATEEELTVLSELGRSAARVHSPATRVDWPSEGRARLWHFSGHAEFRRDNPFYSFLAMSDGPMFAADFRLRTVPVDLVVLAACRSGEQVAVPGEESLGLVRSLLEMGARNVIAGHWPVSDRSAARWTTTFYEHYFRGEDLAESARAASIKLREQYPSAYHWAAFSIFGAGN